MSGHQRPLRSTVINAQSIVLECAAAREERRQIKQNLEERKYKILNFFEILENFEKKIAEPDTASGVCSGAVR